MAMTSSFDWSLVRSFVAVMEAGSVMGAARKLGARQPTLSRHIAELEAQLGVPLFERTGRGVTPTAVGIRIAAAAHQMDDAAHALSLAVAGSGREARGTVRIAASHVAASWLLPPLLARLGTLEPDLQVELVVSNQLSNLLRREADIAVRMLRPQQSSLMAKKLADVHLGAAAHRSYLERAGIPRTTDELMRHRLIGYAKDETIVRGFAALRVPVTRESFALRTDDQVAYAHLVATGAGIGFLALYCLRSLPGVIRVMPQLSIPPLPCWLAVHREIRSNRAVRRVYDFLAQGIPAVLRGERLG